MDYTNEEKRVFCISRIMEFLNTLDTWEKFTDFVNTVSKAKFKARLKQAYLDAQDKGDLVIGSAQEKKIADEAMINEIEETF